MDGHVLAQLMAQGAERGADLVTLRAIAEEAGELGATRALARLGLSDERARGDVAELRHAASQPFTAWFADDPPIEALRAVAGVHDLVVRGREVSGVVDGSPDGLIRELARHHLDHLLLPEPDLEQAFLSLYDDDSEPAS